MEVAVNGVNRNKWKYILEVLQQNLWTQAC